MKRMWNIGAVRWEFLKSKNSSFQPEGGGGWFGGWRLLMSSVSTSFYILISALIFQVDSILLLSQDYPHVDPLMDMVHLPTLATHTQKQGRSTCTSYPQTGSIYPPLLLTHHSLIASQSLEWSSRFLVSFLRRSFFHPLLRQSILPQSWEL